MAPTPVLAGTIADATPESTQKQEPLGHEASFAQTAPETESDIFEIRSIRLLKQPPPDGIGIWRPPPDPKSGGGNAVFVPSLEVSIKVSENLPSDQVIARVHFFDESDRIVASQKTPSRVGEKKDPTRFAMPVLFEKSAVEKIYFVVPDVLAKEKWKALVVFGDTYELKAKTYPQTASEFLLDYPEKEMVNDRSKKRAVRNQVLNPLVEHVVETDSLRQPELTLFLRLPDGVSEGKKVSGVLAICILADYLDVIRRQLMKEEMDGDYRGLLSFANKHNLAIIAWGSRRLWDPRLNYDELSDKEIKEIDRNLEAVFDAWEQGVKKLCGKHDLPMQDFLLWGQSGSAQWAKRLCLRKPDYFLAVHIHVPSSFDQPTPAARKVFWCLTTGERESGYKRSLQFLEECQRLGYPIIYKAIVGLGHAGHPDASALGFRFLEFALNHQHLRRGVDKIVDERTFGRQEDSSSPWPEPFQKPAFYGDIINQEVFPADQADMIPEAFRIPLPDEEIAKAWSSNQ